MRRRLLLAVLALPALLLGLLMLRPCPIEPVPWDPPPSPPLEGVLAPNEDLKTAQILGAGALPGPETVAVDAAGRLYAGCLDGKIRRLTADTPPEVFADTGGRPLGMVFGHRGELLVADAVRGLLSIDADARVEVLSTEAEGQPFGFTDDVAVGPDGRIVFTDATSKFGVDDYKLDLLDGRPSGRLLRYDPATRRTEVLARDLYFPNGVTLTADGQAALVNETWRYRVTRYWLAGPRAGRLEPFAEGLPGFPDGIRRGDDGRYYVALFTVRDGAADFTAPRPWLRSLLVRLPAALWPKPRRYGFVLALDADGRPVRTWHDPSGEHLYEVTASTPVAGYLYLGSLHNDRIGVLKL